MDFKTGRLRGAVSRQDSVFILESLTKAKVNDQLGSDVEVTDVTDEGKAWLVQVQARQGQGKSRTYHVTKDSGAVEEHSN